MSITNVKVIFAFLTLAILSTGLRAQPVINSFSPTSGTVGTVVTINGSAFSATPGNNVVYFGAVKATVSAATTTSLTVTVPHGSTYNPITVTTNRLTSSSAQPFDVVFNGYHHITAASFAAKVDFPSGYWVQNPVVADLDNDGKPDLLNTNSSGIVSIFRNTSANLTLSFAPRFDLATDPFPDNLSAADIDGDGKLDLVVRTSNLIAVYRNTSTTGNISFDNKVDVQGGSSPVCLTVDDYDLDGKADIAMASWNYVYVLRNTTTASTITFAPPVKFHSQINSVISMSAGDMDGDRKADLAIVDHTYSTVTLMRNNSTRGSMAFAVTSSMNVQVRHVAFADFNADGKNDMAMAAIGANMVYVYKNTGGPGVIRFAAKMNVPVDQGPIFCATGDVNGDGKPDLVSLNANTINSPNLSVLTNRGTGDSIQFAPRVEFGTGGGPRAAVIADLNEDEFPDITVAAYQPGTFSVLKSKINDSIRCSGTFSASVITTNAHCGNMYFKGTVTFRSSGGNGTIQYSLDGGSYTTDTARYVSIGKHFLSAMDAGGCTSTLTFEIKQDTSPMKLDAAFNKRTCGDTAGTQVSINVSGGTAPYTYSLSKDSDSLTLMFQTSNVFNNVKVGRYRIHVVDSNECSKEMILTVGYNGEPTLVVAGPIQVCQPASVNLTDGSITTGSDAGLVFSYWLDSLATRSLPNPAAVTASGIYYIKGLAAGGCFAIKPVTVNINTLPVKPVVAASGASNFCKGDSVTLVSSAAGKYQWYKDDVMITGATARNYTAKVTGSYKVITENECGSSTSSAVNIVVNDLPPVPVITASDSLLSSSEPSGNQWYLDGAIIPGATSQQYKPSTAGSYKVKVTSGGCSSISGAMPWPQGTLVCPGNVSVFTNKQCTAKVSNIDASISPGSQLAFLRYTITGATNVSGTGSASGQVFNVGSSIVKYFLENDNAKQCSFNVVVKDTAKPSVDSILLIPSSIWPPDHRLVDVIVNYNTSKGCASLSCALTVSSNEAESGLGDGDIDKDWEVVDQHHVRLRAESFSTAGRIYTISVACSDSAGNNAVKTTTVRVPKQSLEINTGPNPTADQFIINAKSVDDQPMTIRVMDAFGNLIETRKEVPANTIVYIGKNYRPGIYYIEVRQGNTRRVLRLVKV